MKIINWAIGHGIIYYEVVWAGHDREDYIVQTVALHMCNGHVHFEIYKYASMGYIGYIGLQHKSRCIGKWGEK